MSELHSHPISLGQVFFTRSIVIAVPGHELGPDQAPLLPENTISLKKIENPPGPRRSYMGTMRTVMNIAADKAFPYSVDMECVAVLEVDDTLNEEDAFRGAHITAHSVLYGAIREAIAWITGRHPYGQVTLGLSILKAGNKASDPAPTPAAMPADTNATQP